MFDTRALVAIIAQVFVIDIQSGITNLGEVLVAHPNSWITSLVQAMGAEFFPVLTELFLGKIPKWIPRIIQSLVANANGRRIVAIEAPVPGVDQWWTHEIERTVPCIGNRLPLLVQVLMSRCDVWRVETVQVTVSGVGNGLSLLVQILMSGCHGWRVKAIQVAMSGIGDGLTLLV